jgi:hypothetical protein
MTFLQLLRYILSLPLNLMWPGETREEQEKVQLYDFVEIAFFNGFFALLIWWMGVIGFGT